MSSSGIPTLHRGRKAAPRHAPLSRAAMCLESDGGGRGAEPSGAPWTPRRRGLRRRAPATAPPDRHAEAAVLQCRAPTSAPPGEPASLSSAVPVGSSERRCEGSSEQRRARAARGGELAAGKQGGALAGEAQNRRAGRRGHLQAGGRSAGETERARERGRDHTGAGDGERGASAKMPTGFCGLQNGKARIGVLAHLLETSFTVFSLFLPIHNNLHKLLEMLLARPFAASSLRLYLPRFIFI